MLFRCFEGCGAVWIGFEVILNICRELVLKCFEGFGESWIGFNELFWMCWRGFGLVLKCFEGFGEVWICSEMFWVFGDVLRFLEGFGEVWIGSESVLSGFRNSLRFLGDVLSFFLGDGCGVVWIGFEVDVVNWFWKVLMVLERSWIGIEMFWRFWRGFENIMGAFRSSPLIPVVACPLPYNTSQKGWKLFE